MSHLQNLIESHGSVDNAMRAIQEHGIVSLEEEDTEDFITAAELFQELEVLNVA